MERSTFPIMLSVLLLLILRALADPTIVANTNDPFTMDCDNPPPNSWVMVKGGLARVTIPGSGHVNCNFDSIQRGVHVTQGFSVTSPVAGVKCMPDGCVWTVAPDGFYVHDIISNSDILA